MPREADSDQRDSRFGLVPAPLRPTARATAHSSPNRLNGDWERFVQYVHDRVRQQGLEHGVRIRIQQKEPAPLPVIEEAA